MSTIFTLSWLFGLQTKVKLWSGDQNAKALNRPTFSVIGKGSIVLLFLLAFLCIPDTIQAQSASELRAKRKQILQEIEENNQLLAETKKSKAAALKRIATLQRQIRKRQELVETLRKEINFTEESINRTTDVAASLRLDLDRLKREYSQLLRTAYRARLQRSWVYFIFSAEGFNDAFRRWQYLRQYNRYRRRQARLMNETTKMLDSKLNQLAERRSEKEQLLQEQEGQQQQLSKERKDKDVLLDDIKNNESKLLTKLEEQEKARENLNSSIEAAIRAEMDKKRIADRSNTNTATSRAETSTSTAAPSGLNFGKQRGKLPWPSQGSVSRSFGKQAHPDLPNIQISNNGIDISAGRDATVRAVFAGEVVSTQFIPGYRHTILVQHGDYYTVYSNLEKVEVNKGQQLGAGSVIGRTGNDGGDLHFEIWKEKSRLNPSRWLKRK